MLYCDAAMRREMSLMCRQCSLAEYLADAPTHPQTSRPPSLVPQSPPRASRLTRSSAPCSGCSPSRPHTDPPHHILSRLIASRHVMPFCYSSSSASGAPFAIQCRSSGPSAERSLTMTERGEVSRRKSSSRERTQRKRRLSALTGFVGCRAAEMCASVAVRGLVVPACSPVYQSACETQTAPSR